MRISLNTIRRLNQHYDCTGEIAPDGVEALVEKIGAQLGAVEEIIDLNAKYQGIIIAKIVKCDKHPDADKLKVCKIDDGGVAKDIERDVDGLVQVVCGAPNARAGIFVAWLPPGATVPSTVGKEPFVLETRDLRGQLSNGMLASPRELALGDNHDGILEIEGDQQPGSDFAKTTGLDDFIIDIENKMFTHRPDCFGFLGVSRELAGIQGMPFKSPDWYTLNPKFPDIEAEELPLKVQNDLPELVSRFVAIAMADVQIGPSPLWLQVAMAEAGIKSISNIVDYSNWYMIETGQPIHIYDYDKVKALSQNEPTIVVRNPHSGEKIQLLNGKETEPRPEAILIATDKQAIGIGGVMGGSETEVDTDTKNIIIEVASFDMYSVRRTSMTHGLFTDAVTRFTKGQSPLQDLAVLAKIVDEIRGHAGGKVASQLIDDNHLSAEVLERSSLYPPVKVSRTFINERLGSELTVDDMRKLLQNVEFKVEVQADELTVTAPFWRTDIELPEDVVEEIGRLYGYDRLPLKLPKRDLTPAKRDPLLELKAKIRARLATAGANEVLTYSFVHGQLLDKVGQPRDQAFQIANALSPDLQYYRLSLLPSLLDKVHANIKAGYDEFALFELGKAHLLDKTDDDSLPEEFERLALVLAAADKLQKSGAAYYQACQYMMNLLETFGLADSISLTPLQPDDQDTATVYFAPGRAARVKIGDQIIGCVGEFKPEVRRALKLPVFSAGFELGLTPVSKLTKASDYVPLSRFPKVVQDLTLQVPAELTYAELYDFVKQTIAAEQPDQSTSRLDPVDIYQSPDDPAHKNISFRLTIASYDRTLTDAEVNQLLDKVAIAATTKLNADRI